MTSFGDETVTFKSQFFGCRPRELNPLPSAREAEAIADELPGRQPFFTWA